MTVFEAVDYKQYLKSRAEEARGNLTALAKTAQCQPSYLLRVIHQEAQLTPDQSYRLCAHWGLEPEERIYFMTQVEWARAADPSYRSHLKKDLEQMLNAHNNLKEVVKRTEVSDVQTLLEYHSDWRTSLVHFLSACREYQTKNKLGTRVKLGPTDLNEILKYLADHDLISIEKEAVEFKNGVGHIPKGSPILPIFLNHWRQQAVQNSLKLKQQSVHFTNIQTIGKEDVQKLIELAKQFIQKSKSLCDESQDEDVVVLNLDVFVPHS